MQLLKQGEQAMQICNACRYCEGFCAVFPAMERRLTFPPSDLKYLANLCHDCRECLYSCQYAPPHEFGLNLPKVMAGLRGETYREAAWPSSAVRFFGRTRPALALSLLLGPALFLLAAVYLAGGERLFSAHSLADGSFYRVIPHGVMVTSFTAVAFSVCVALMMGFRNFWREAGVPSGLKITDVLRAARDSLSLRYLGGDGTGCAYPDERASKVRRWYHHLTFYGFSLCFASTTTAAVYHNFLGWQAPYEVRSLPVLLGVVGGIGLCVGPLGLLHLKSIRDPEAADPTQTRMDVGFLLLLLLTSVTGLLLLALRETAAMGVILVIHLGVVLGLFLTLPYGKFVHGIYRFGALVRFSKEEREP